MWAGVVFTGTLITPTGPMVVPGYLTPTNKSRKSTFMRGLIFQIYFQDILHGSEADIHVRQHDGRLRSCSVRTPTWHKERHATFKYVINSLHMSGKLKTICSRLHCSRDRRGYPSFLSKFPILSTKNAHVFQENTSTLVLWRQAAGLKASAAPSSIRSVIAISVWMRGRKQP